jgi:superfamily II DNA helicase RecQ
MPFILQEKKGRTDSPKKQQESKKARKNSLSVQVAASVEAPVSSDLLNRLTDLKKQICEEERKTDSNIMPHHIFTGYALEGVCKIMPSTLAQLAQVEGLPKAKIDKYGSRILAVVREYQSSLSRSNRIILDDSDE